MSLRISVFLLFVLFTAGHSLSCCTGFLGCNPDTCTSQLTNCLALTGYSGSQISQYKSCYDASKCPYGSADLGYIKASSYCCSTDQCNAQDPPGLPTNNPNGKSCYYCEGNICNKTMSCMGNQDQCVKLTVSTGSETVIYKGCASSSYCTSTIPFTSFQNYTCCAGNLCNGGESVTQSFLFLCCFLFSVLVMH